MEVDGRRIQLLPAWPREWTADFKLHAPYRTSVAGQVSGDDSMTRFREVWLLAVALVLPALPVVVMAGTDTARANASPLAPQPPMGWNSWDAYGRTIDETQFKAN